jgi:hypothetical protein
MIQAFRFRFGAGVSQSFGSGKFNINIANYATLDADNHWRYSECEVFDERLR